MTTVAWKTQSHLQMLSSTLKRKRQLNCKSNVPQNEWCTNCKNKNKCLISFEAREEMNMYISAFQCGKENDSLLWCPGCKSKKQCYYFSTRAEISDSFEFCVQNLINSPSTKRHSIAPELLTVNFRPKKRTNSPIQNIIYIQPGSEEVLNYSEQLSAFQVIMLQKKVAKYARRIADLEAEKNDWCRLRKNPNPEMCKEYPRASLF